MTNISILHLFLIIHTPCDFAKKSFERMYFFLHWEAVTFFPKCANGVYHFIVDHVLLSRNQSALQTKGYILEQKSVHSKLLFIVGKNCNLREVLCQRHVRAHSKRADYQLLKR